MNTTTLSSPETFFAAWRAMCEKKPTSPERAAWDALDQRQKQFILRGLGIDPDTFALCRMTTTERRDLFRCIEGWAGTASRLKEIMHSCRDQQQREHLAAVQSHDHQQPAKRQQGRAA